MSSTPDPDATPVEPAAPEAIQAESGADTSQDLNADIAEGGPVEGKPAGEESAGGDEALSHSVGEAPAGEPAGDETAEPVAEVEPDARLFEAHDLALAALREITPDATIGGAAGYFVEPGGVVSLRFENRLPGYPGWFWTVTVGVVEGSEPTVLETELLPGEGALLAPDWVPWAERLADYQAAQAALAEAERDRLGDDAEAADLEDIEDLDASDFDDDGSPILHAGDVDGVDIDELADEINDDSEDDDSDEDDDSEDDDEDDDLDDSEDDFEESDDEEDDLPEGVDDDLEDDDLDDEDDDEDDDLDDDAQDDDDAPAGRRDDD